MVKRILDYLESQIWSVKLPCGAMWLVEDRQARHDLCEAFAIVAINNEV